jgi:uncharacterized protein
MPRARPARRTARIEQNSVDKSKIFLISLAIGLVAGLFGGLIGLGGGIIMIPLMTRVLKLTQHQAHGTSLVALIFTGLSGAVIYGLHGDVGWTAAALLSATAVVTARAGAMYADRLPAWKLRRWFGVLLLGCAAFLLAKPCLPQALAHRSDYLQALIFLLTGSATGFLSGMMGVGGGTVMVPAMVLLAGFDQHIAQGTSLTVMVPMGAAGAVTHQKLGNVATPYLPGLILGILIGASVGGKFAHFIPELPLRWSFIAALAVIGANDIKIKASPKPRDLPQDG